MDDLSLTLLARLGDGDEQAAEEVFRRYEPYLRKVVRRRLPPGLRAKFDSLDVVQSVWLDVLRGLKRAGWHFPDAAHLRAFLVKATRNRLIDRARHHRPSLEHQQALPAGPGAAEPTSPEPRPSQVVGAGDAWDRLLALCPPEHHELLRLKRAGLGVPEIAARVGLHEDSVWRVLRQLARRFALEQEGG
jgi:RNA polymerase sigma-70 factor (ECF subfamily)